MFYSIFLLLELVSSLQTNPGVMKNILLPTDFSLNAQNAMEYALSIFKDRECNFFIMNAFQVGTSGLMTTRSRMNNTRLFRLLKEESERELKNGLKRIRKANTNPKHLFTALSVAEHLSNAIRKTVHSKKIDYIVMGAKSAKSFKAVFWGNHTYKTIKAINFCPIIAVPEQCKSRRTIATIVLATSYEHFFEAYQLKPLLQLAQSFDAEIQVVYIGKLDELTPAQKSAKEAIQKHLKQVKHSFVTIAKEVSVSSTLQKVVEDNRSIDMVAMLDHCRGFPEKLTREAVIKRFFLNTQVPLLVMHCSKQNKMHSMGGVTRFINRSFTSKQKQGTASKQQA